MDLAVKMTLINIYPAVTKAHYLLSSYVLKGYLDKYFSNTISLNVEVMNISNKTDPLEISKSIHKREPHIIGFSCYIWNIELVVDTINKLIDVSSFTYILGGPEISLNRIKTLKIRSESAYFVIGEGEKVLLKLLKFIVSYSKRDSASLPDGVAVMKKDAIIFSPNTDKLKDLDEVPSVYLNGVVEDKLYKYQQVFLETQRGCNFKCKYCVYHKDLPLILTYSEERILNEIEFLILEKHVTAIRIIDAVFSNNIDRAKRIALFLNHIKNDNNIRLPWIYWEFTYNCVDDEFFRLISELKCRENILNSKFLKPKDRIQSYGEMLKDYTVVNAVGIQSLRADSLRLVNRPPINIKRLETFFESVKQYNIVLKIDIIIGLPLETFKSYFDGLEYLLQFLKDTDHILNIHCLQILPGSDMEKVAEENGINYSISAPHIIYSTNSFSETELNYASKLSAILFRIVNSPIRAKFYAAKEKSGNTFFSLIESVYNLLIDSIDFSGTYLLRNNLVDDEYWNGNIYKDLPSSWLIDILDNNIKS